MNPKRETNGAHHQKPRNKANMDQPQEEFIEPECAHADHDRDHGHEVTHSLLRPHDQRQNFPGSE